MTCNDNWFTSVPEDIYGIAIKIRYYVEKSMKEHYMKVQQ